MIRIFTLLSLVAVFNFSFGQMTKEEKKKWKKERKMAGIEGYKQMSQENTRLLLENRALKKNLDAAEKEALANLERMRKIEAERDSLYSAVAQSIKRNKSVPRSISARSAEKGVSFKVQIGAFNNFDLSKYFGNHRNFGIEEDEDGTLKYTLGIFKTYNEAEKFKSLMHDMGVTGAWVVSYQNNERVDIKELEVQN